MGQLLNMVDIYIYPISMMRSLYVATNIGAKAMADQGKTAETQRMSASFQKQDHYWNIYV